MSLDNIDAECLPFSHATVKLKSVLYDPWDLEALFISGSFSSINT
jgi:hypothetical protein